MDIFAPYEQAHRQEGEARQRLEEADRQLRDAVRARISPSAAQRTKVNQTQHRDNNRRGQYGLRQVMQQRGQQHDAEADTGGGEHSSHGSLRAGVIVDHRTRKTTGDREATAKGCAKVGSTQAE